MSLWTYTLSATLVVVLLNVQAPGTWAAWAQALLGNVTQNTQLQQWFLDILVVGGAFSIGLFNLRRIRKGGENRGYARAVSEGHHG